MHHICTHAWLLPCSCPLRPYHECGYTCDSCAPSAPVRSSAGQCLDGSASYVVDEGRRILQMPMTQQVSLRSRPISLPVYEQVWASVGLHLSSAMSTKLGRNAAHATASIARTTVVVHCRAAPAVGASAPCDSCSCTTMWHECVFAAAGAASAAAATAAASAAAAVGASLTPRLAWPGAELRLSIPPGQV